MASISRPLYITATVYTWFVTQYHEVLVVGIRAFFPLRNKQVIFKIKILL